MNASSWVGPVTLLAALGLVGGLAVACGSASETPWPVEPIDIEGGPEGEDRPPGTDIDVRDLPVDPRWRDAGSSPETDPIDQDPVAPDPPASDPLLQEPMTP